MIIHRLKIVLHEDQTQAQTQTAIEAKTTPLQDLTTTPQVQAVITQAEDRLAVVIPAVVAVVAEDRLAAVAEEDNYFSILYLNKKYNSN